MNGHSRRTGKRHATGTSRLSEGIPKESRQFQFRSPVRLCQYRTLHMGDAHYSGVTPGEFLERVYYQLNVIHLRATSRSAAWLPRHTSREHQLGA